MKRLYGSLVAGRPPALVLHVLPTHHTRLLPESAPHATGFAADMEHEETGTAPRYRSPDNPRRDPPVSKRIRCIVAGLTLATAAATGAVITHTVAAPRIDTTWGASDTADDTTWGSEPVDLPVTLPVDLPTITPLDTTWG